MEIGGLIKDLSPHYNQYKKNKFLLSGTESLQIMWDIGDILQKFLSQNDIAPHKLFWTVYGNSEGRSNVTRKSYITREFQNRCHRIRKIFDSKKQIFEIFPKLRNFVCFREAMPFFDNEKYILKGDERQNLLHLLNSTKSSKEILEIIYKLQKERIGIKNPRTQRLGDVEGEKNIFISFYNSIYRLLKSLDYNKALVQLTTNDVIFLNVLSKNTSCLSNEGLKKFEMKIPRNINGVLREFALVVNKLLNKEEPKERRRFRRLIPPERIVKLADMIYAFTSERNFDNFR